MESINSKIWWTFFIRGCIATLYGFLAFLWMPFLELGTIIFVFLGMYILIHGALSLNVYLRINKNKQSLPVLLETVLGISVGTFLVLQTDFTEAFLIVSFIAWGISTGICQVIRAAFLYKNQKFYLVLGINSLLSIFFNLMIYIKAEMKKKPIAGILGIYFVVFATLMIIFGVSLTISQD